MDGNFNFSDPEASNPCELRKLAEALPPAIREELSFGSSNKGIIYINGERRHGTIPDARRIRDHIVIDHRLDTPNAAVFCVRVDIPLVYKMGQQDVHTMRLEISIEKEPASDPDLEKLPPNAADTIRSAVAAGAVTIAGILSLVTVTYGVSRAREDIQKLIDNICQILPQCPF